MSEKQEHLLLWGYVAMGMHKRMAYLSLGKERRIFEERIFRLGSWSIQEGEFR